MRPSASPKPPEFALLSLALHRVCGRPGQDERPALPAGHPISWGLITRNTLLEDAEYPYPVFDL